MLVRNARRCALPESLRDVIAPQSISKAHVDEEEDGELCDAVAPLSSDPLEAENDATSDDDAKASHRGNHGASRAQRRSTSAFNRSNGLVLSATYLTATYGGAPAFYSLWLGEKCSSTVVVHLQCVGDSHTTSSKAASLRLSCDRLEFAPHNFSEPQLVRVELVEPSGGMHMVLHRVFSLDSNYDRLVTPNVVVKTERSNMGALLSLGGALVHTRKNAKGEIMAPRLAANRTIDVTKALAAASTTAVAAATPAATTTTADMGSCSLSSSSLSSVPLVAAKSPPVFVSHVAAGYNFSSLVVKPQGGVETVLVWGMNANGELGIGSTTPMVEPVPLLTLPPPQVPGDFVSIVSISCGKHHAAVVTTHGRLFTWGNNKYGQLGLGDYTNVHTPHEVVFAGALIRAAPSRQRALRLKHAMLDYGNNNTNVTQVACGAFHTLFVTHQQHVLSMGYNQAGQLGVGHRLQQYRGWRSCAPAMVETLHDCCILDIAAGQNHSACVLSNGDVFAWGCGGDGRLGVPLRCEATDSRSRSQYQSQSECEVEPVPILSLKDIGVRARAVRCGGRHTAILSDRDLLYVWGANEFGQLGVGDKRCRLRPCLVPFTPFLQDGVVDVSLGEFHSACVTWSGDAYVWGLDLGGEQSIRLDQRCAPERVMLASEQGSAVRIACGWAHTTVITHASGDGVSKSSDSRDASPRKPPIHVHRRKENALKFSARQQEVAKWRRVSMAIGLMGDPPSRRVNGSKQSRKKKAKNSMNLVHVVNSALLVSSQILRSQEPENEQIKAVTEAFVTSAVEEALRRVIVRLIIIDGPKRSKKQRRPASTPGRSAMHPIDSSSPPQGVFYHTPLQLLSPPTLPPPCLLPPASSPRHTVVGISVVSPGVESERPWSPTPPCSSRRSRTPRPVSATLSPRPVQCTKDVSGPQTPPNLTASCASLLSALQDDNPRNDEDKDELRPPTLSTSQASRRFGAIESLFHTPSFSLTSHLVGGGSSSRGVRPTRLRR